jgi:hypothetical protein
MEFGDHLHFSAALTPRKGRIVPIGYSEAKGVEASNYHTHAAALISERGDGWDNGEVMWGNVRLEGRQSLDNWPRVELGSPCFEVHYF